VTKVHASALGRFAHAAPPRSALALLPRIIGTPRAAKDVATTTPLHATRLGGLEAAGITYTYTYAGVPNVQTDIVSRNGDQISTVELDAEPMLTSKGDSALNVITAHWRWD
jgi:hypothetical protein